MNSETQRLLGSAGATTCLCCDAEFARGQEMLELSIADLHGRLVYQQRFKPRRYRTWDSDIHHITPAMVATAPSFSSCRKRIQAVFDRCTYILGFAVRENDIAKLKRQFVQGLDSKQVLELRDWFWVCHGREHGLDYVQGISLKSVCDNLGISQDESRAHSAAYDTEVTLRCFTILFDKFVEKHAAQRHYADFHEVVQHFESVFKKHKHEYDAERATGYCAIVRTAEKDQYLLKATRERPEIDENTIEVIAVADRKQALMRLSRSFTGNARARAFFFKKLTDERIRAFRRMNSSK
ncbi:MAG: hypothetical protein K2L21_00240 [Muribaculaceae bacterium]|nr:hypothetical protein [Muribaculaceae bacterium]